MQEKERLDKKLAKAEKEKKAQAALHKLQISYNNLRGELHTVCTLWHWQTTNNPPDIVWTARPIDLAGSQRPQRLQLR